MTKKVPKPPWLKLVIRLIRNQSNDALDTFKIAASTGDIVRVPKLNSVHFINSPEAISHIMVHNESNYTKKGTSFQQLENYMGPGLLTNYDHRWAVTRKQVQREFYYKYIKHYLPVIISTTERLLDNWASRPGESVDLVHEMSQLILEIASVTLFGADIQNESACAIPKIRTANEYVAKSPFLRLNPPSLKNWRYRRGRNFVDNLVNKMLTLPHPYSETIKPALRCLWHKTTDSPEEKLRHLHEAKNFVIAGHETTGSSLTWSLYTLSKYPAVLEELLTEIDSLNGKPPTLEQLEALDYTSMVIDESLRLYPPIWIFDRAAIADDIVCGYRIPAKSLLYMVPFTLHRHPKYWPNPEVFDPERFRKGATAKYVKNAYIPFGLGPHVCVGKHLAQLIMKVVLPMILQRFELAIDPKLEVGIDALISIKPDSPVPMKLKPRK